MAAGRGGGLLLLTADSSRTRGYCEQEEEVDGGAAAVTRGRRRATAMCCGKWPHNLSVFGQRQYFLVAQSKSHTPTVSPSQFSLGEADVEK